MSSIRSKKTSPRVPWTFVASGKDDAPRRVLLARVDAAASARKGKSAPRKVNPLQVVRRLEKAFIKTVRTIKQNATKKG
jgi:hypothetical protein